VGRTAKKGIKGLVWVAWIGLVMFGTIVAIESVIVRQVEALVVKPQEGPAVAASAPVDVPQPYGALAVGNISVE
jgi:hypothetical protein